MTSPRLSAEQRRAVTLLASIPRGIAEELLILAHHFDRAMMAGLVHEGLATAERERERSRRAGLAGCG
jgi:hypothetical protein